MIISTSGQGCSRVGVVEVWLTSKELLSMLMNSSLAMTSNFFWSSPWIFVSPTALPLTGDQITQQLNPQKRAIQARLQARAAPQGRMSLLKAPSIATPMTLEVKLTLIGTHRLANPALRTAVEMALMAVSRELRSIVREPVVCAILRCSLSTKRVSVIVSTLISSTGRGAAMLLVQQSSQTGLRGS